jgi:hypothetical protein
MAGGTPSITITGSSGSTSEVGGYSSYSTATAATAAAAHLPRGGCTQQLQLRPPPPLAPEGMKGGNVCLRNVYLRLYVVVCHAGCCPQHMVQRVQLQSTTHRTRVEPPRNMKKHTQRGQNVHPHVRTKKNPCTRTHNTKAINTAHSKQTAHRTHHTAHTVNTAHITHGPHSTGLIAHSPQPNRPQATGHMPQHTAHTAHTPHKAHTAHTVHTANTQRTQRTRRTQRTERTLRSHSPSSSRCRAPFGAHDGSCSLSSCGNGGVRG